MAWVFVSRDWTGIDISALARPWAPTESGYVRCGTSAGAVQRVQYGINHLLGRQPRVTFCHEFHQQSQLGTWDIELNAAPLFSHHYSDYWRNGQRREYRALVIPRDDGNDWNSDKIAICNSNYMSGTSPGYVRVEDAATAWPNNLELLEWTVTRNGAANAITTEHINSYNGLRIVDLVAQDQPKDFLDTSTDVHATALGVAPGGEIIAGAAESIREAIHNIALHDLPIDFQWHAQRVESVGWDQSAEGNNRRALCTVISGSDWINPLDGSAARTAATPGFSCHGYKAGRGVSNSAGVRVFLLAKAGGANAIVNVVGPDHRAGNWCSFSLDAADAAQWYTAGDLVYLNTEVDDSCTNTGRNKFDILIQRNGSPPETGQANVAIFGIVGQREYL